MIVQFGAESVGPEIVDTDTPIAHRCLMGGAVSFTWHAILRDKVVIGYQVRIGPGSAVLEPRPADNALNAVVGDVAQPNARSDGAPTSE